MKKVGFIILCLLMLTLHCPAKNSAKAGAEADAPKVFIYHIPDDTETESQVSGEIRQQTDTQTDIVSDDITADTSQENALAAEQETDGDDDYEIDDMYSDVLKGYAEYNEDEEDAISLEDENDFHELNIKLPAKIHGGKYTAASGSLTSPSLSYSKFNNVEYSIAPVSTRNYRSKNGFTAGAMYDQGIDYAELEQSTGIFSRYENKYFALSTAYAKTVNTTNNNYNDNFYFSPELKLNQYFTLKEILSADITRNRKKAEVVLSINPFGNKDTDRLRFEIGANATYDDATSSILKKQVKFSTKFSL